MAQDEEAAERRQPAARLQRPAAPHLYFEVRPAGDKTPRIDPEPKSRNTGDVRACPGFPPSRRTRLALARTRTMASMSGFRFLLPKDG